MKRIAWLLPSVLCAGIGTDALAQVPESERSLVTDPDVLASMGFSRDASNVYRARSLDQTPSEVPGDWGSNFHYTSVVPTDFMGRSHRPLVEWKYRGESGFLSRWGDEIFAIAPLYLPTGATLEAFRWWADDDDPDIDLSIWVLEECQPPFGPGPPVLTIIGMSVPATSGSGGDQSGVLAGSGTTVNNQACIYMVELLFPGMGAPLDTLRFEKLRVQWARQVSPAPPVATFGDVPTNHPFFQFVEALAASGITAGCGAGNYCPDAPLTRGQMAVFLSIALGLYFP